MIVIWSDNNIEQHNITNMQKYGVPVTVAINQFITDTNDELAVITECCEKLSVKSTIYQ